MKRSVLVILLITTCFSQVATANTAYYTELVGATGKINWTTGTISATGYGIAPSNKKPTVAHLLACRAAIVDAQRNLLESFQGVRVSSTTLINNYMLTNDKIKSSVEGTIKGATIKSKENRNNGTCKVVLQAPLRGNAANSIYQSLYDPASLSAFNFLQLFSPFISTVHASTLSNSTQTVEQQLQQLTKRITELETLVHGSNHSKSNRINLQSTTISGVVIDVRGSRFIPSLNPKLRQPAGDILYPTEKTAASIIDNGQLVSLFATDVAFAMEHPLVGDTPLLIKANRTWKNNATEITLAQKDADKIAYLVSNDLLNDIGVIIVLE